VWSAGCVFVVVFVCNLIICLTRIYRYLFYVLSLFCLYNHLPRIFDLGYDPYNCLARIFGLECDLCSHLARIFDKGCDLCNHLSRIFDVGCDLYHHLARIFQLGYLTSDFIYIIM
jgi:hypothetical protein